MAEQVKLRAAEKTVHKFRFMWKWGRLCAFTGIGLVVLWFFTASFGWVRDLFGVLGNVLLFSGMAVAYVGFRGLASLMQKLQNSVNGLTCPLCGKEFFGGTVMCSECRARLEGQMK